MNAAVYAAWILLLQWCQFQFWRHVTKTKNSNANTSFFDISLRLVKKSSCHCVNITLYILFKLFTRQTHFGQHFGLVMMSCRSIRCHYYSPKKIVTSSLAFCVFMKIITQLILTVQINPLSRFVYQTNIWICLVYC